MATNPKAPRLRRPRPPAGIQFGLFTGGPVPAPPPPPPPAPEGAPGDAGALALPSALRTAAPVQVQNWAAGRHPTGAPPAEAGTGAARGKCGACRYRRKTPRGEKDRCTKAEARSRASEIRAGWAACSLWAAD
jgi:hypothetical protein